MIVIFKNVQRKLNIIPLNIASADPHRRLLYLTSPFNGFQKLWVQVKSWQTDDVKSHIQEVHWGGSIVSLEEKKDEVAFEEESDTVFHVKTLWFEYVSSKISFCSIFVIVVNLYTLRLKLFSNFYKLILYFYKSFKHHGTLLKARVLLVLMVNMVLQEIVCSSGYQFTGNYMVLHRVYLPPCCRRHVFEDLTALLFFICTI